VSDNEIENIADSPLNIKRGNLHRTNSIKS